MPLRFSVDQRTNSIIASGNPGDLDVVCNILARLDVADLRQRITTVYRLHNAPAADVATAINNLLDAAARPEPDRAGAGHARPADRAAK